MELLKQVANKIDLQTKNETSLEHPPTTNPYIFIINMPPAFTATHSQKKKK